jgi:N-acyl-D-aspartate/D-glutamate deacylase
MEAPMLDVVIKGGELIDGTGAPRRRADVGISGDRVVALGSVSDPAATTIDATGKIVAPGFVDVHTHYDAQVFGDGALTPSPLHGVTTALAGNCGFTIAPLSDDPADGDYLMKMLARVEGMPLESLRSGVPWDWKSTGDYFAAVEPRLGINAGFMVGHSAMRRVVMGDDATRREATPEELERMKTLLREGLAAGGIGFSSSWARTHNDPDGRMVPSRYGSREELVELARTAGEFAGTSLELIPMVGPFESWAVQLMADMSAAAQRPLNWNVMAVTAGNLTDCERKLDAGTYAAEHGGRVIALTVPMSFPLRLSFRSGFILDAMPNWEGPMLLPLDQKLALFRDPEARSRLNAAAQSESNPMRALADWRRMRIFDVFAAENQQYRGKTVGEIADAEGRDPWDVLCTIALADDLNTGFGTQPVPESDDDWKARLQIWRDSRALIGASDAGAHLDLFSTANYATHLLGSAVRERNLLPLEEAVQMITQTPAEVYGLRERGALHEGWKADVVVFDPATVGPEPVEMRFDLPGGAGRLYGESAGIEQVLVNGTPIVRDGALTQARAGKLLRSGTDTRNPAMS